MIRYSAKTQIQKVSFMEFRIKYLRIDTAEDEHSEKYTRGLILTKKRIVKNVFRVPPVLGSIVKNLEKAMVLSKGCFIGLLKAISGLFR